MKKQPTLNKKFLLILADYLYKVRRNRFYFATWVGADWKGDKDLSCGTTACALGHATMIPKFRKMGLRLFKGRGIWSGQVVGVALGRRLPCTCYSDAADISFRAAMRLFGLTPEQALFLFAPEQDLAGFKKPSPGTNATPKQVARHIRNFVKVMSK
jgi:hypothetical protein